MSEESSFNQKQTLAVEVLVTSLGDERDFCGLCALVIMARLSSPSRSWWQALVPSACPMTKFSARDLILVRFLTDERRTNDGYPYVRV